MNDSAIRDFCITARNELREQVARRALLYGIGSEGYVDPAADVVDGRVLAPEEIEQRKELVARFLAGPEGGYAERYEALIERAAYTWFNRLVAIRYMEVNDRLPSHVRMLSATDGSFALQAMAEALQIDIAGIDRARVAELVSAADDEALFRYLFLAQCDELAACLPDVFEPIGSAMELLLPDGLLRRGGVACQLVEDIPEQDWIEGVEIVGWMYQYYNAERKDEVFASFKKGKKAEADALAPATQLFTPDWIVRYLVENSLGGLWLQAHPDSALADSMPYYIPDEAGVADDANNVILSERSESKNPAISSPEDITVIDPACGSGHILVYAFDLLAHIYGEVGYSRRDIPQLILQHNLSGIEIDPRAAALASFALSMKGCELDSRFLARRVFPKVTTIVPVELDEGELEALPMLAERTALLDAMAHASECGSLFVPEPEDMIALARAKADLESRGDLLSAGLLEKVEAMIANCEPLARTYDVVVANPPYMGSSNMGKCLASWTKKNYPDSKRDLCTCFIERGFTLAKAGGYSAMVTMQSWMFLGSFEAMRKKMLKEHSIATMAHLGTRAFDAIGGEVVATTATVFCNSASGQPASYMRLVDFENEAAKETAIREAIANPDCGWFYRHDASAFSAIPGSPIAYWASDAMRKAFEEMPSISNEVDIRLGMTTSDNDRFVRFWWEPSLAKEDFSAVSAASIEKWVPYNKGGEFRKWYGNRFFVLNWENEGFEIRNIKNESGRIRSTVPNEQFYFHECLTWSKISSGRIALRYLPKGTIFDVAGASGFGEKEMLLECIAFLNSSVVNEMLGFLSPTLNFEGGIIRELPFSKCLVREALGSSQKSIAMSQQDYDSFETSWDFKRHPMV